MYSLVFKVWMKGNVPESININSNDLPMMIRHITPDLDEIFKHLKENANIRIIDLWKHTKNPFQKLYKISETPGNLEKYYTKYAIPEGKLFNSTF